MAPPVHLGADAAAVSGSCAPHAESSGNLSVDPRLAASYSLTKSSPVIDLGESDRLPGMPTDFNDAARVVDGDLDGAEVIDLRAFELQSEAPAVPAFGSIGVSMLSVLLGAGALRSLRRSSSAS
jgi:hypothetical protein